MSATTDEVSQLKSVNKLLNSHENRLNGLLLLQSHINTFDNNSIIENCVNWMQQCCKIDVGDIHMINVSSETLKKLLIISANYSELNTSVCNFVNTRFFDFFFKYASKTEVGWSCAEVCFSLFSGPCGQHLEKIEKSLKGFIEKKKISHTKARCFALLPCLGGGGKGGINHLNNWKSQFLTMISNCHVILNHLFKNVTELQEYSVENELFPEGNVPSSKELIIYLNNYCSILQQMLCMKYPTSKSIAADQILNLICRGLSVTPATLGPYVTFETIWLKSVLPDIHEALFNCLSALMACCKTSLLPYAHLICKLIQQSFSWTQTTGTYGNEKQYSLLRISAYSALSNWLIVTKSGGLAETISKVVIEAFVDDINIKKPELTLQTTPKNIKASRKEKAKAQQVDANANASLCYSALKSMQLYLNSVGELLSEKEHKLLQTTVISILSEIHRSSSSKEEIPYSNAICRQELYSILLALTINPSSKWPPPTQFALLFFNGGRRDSHLKVSQFCSLALNSVMTIIHPGFNVASFPQQNGLEESQDEEVQRSVKLRWRTQKHAMDETYLEPSFTDIHKEPNKDLSNEVIEKESEKELEPENNSENEPSIDEKDVSDVEELISDQSEDVESSEIEEVEEMEVEIISMKENEDVVEISQEKSPNAKVQTPNKSLILKENHIEVEVGDSTSNEEQELHEEENIKILSTNEMGKDVSETTEHNIENDSEESAMEITELQSNKNQANVLTKTNETKSNEIPESVSPKVEQSPSKNTEVQQSPSKNAQVQKSPSKNSQVQQSPKNAEVQQSPSRNAELQQSPSRNAELQQSPSRNAELQQSPTKNTEVQQSPSKNSQVEQSPSKESEEERESPHNKSTDSSKSLTKDSGNIEEVETDDVASSVSESEKGGESSRELRYLRRSRVWRKSESLENKSPSKSESIASSGDESSGKRLDKAPSVVSKVPIIMLSDIQNASPSKRYFLRSKQKDDNVMTLKSGTKVRHPLKPETSSPEEESKEETEKHKKVEEDEDIMNSFNDTLNPGD